MMYYIYSLIFFLENMSSKWHESLDKHIIFCVFLDHLQSLVMGHVGKDDLIRWQNNSFQY